MKHQALFSLNDESKKDESVVYCNFLFVFFFTFNLLIMLHNHPGEYATIVSYFTSHSAASLPKGDLLSSRDQV